MLIVRRAADFIVFSYIFFGTFAKNDRVTVSRCSAVVSRGFWHRGPYIYIYNIIIVVIRYHRSLSPSLPHEVYCTCGVCGRRLVDVWGYFRVLIANRNHVTRSHCRRRLRTVLRRREEKKNYQCQLAFFSRGVFSVATVRVGRSSLCDDENYAGGGGRVFRSAEDDDDNKITPLCH